MTVAWLNGALVDAAEARIDPSDRGFTLGDGVFETIRAVNGTPAHETRHFARLQRGAETLGITLPWPAHDLSQALLAVLRANQMQNAALRLTLTRGPAPRGILPSGAVSPTVLITAGPLPAPAGPAHLVVAQHVRRNEFSPLSRIKSLNYLDNILARQEAAACGADDAVLLNTQGFVAEATAANLFLRIDSTWVTPRVSDGALPGVMRSVILDSRPVREDKIAAPSLMKADAAFLANSLGVRVINHIGEHLLKSEAAVASLALHDFL